LQSWLRAIFEWGRDDYYFPNIRSLGGAATLITLVLYPYVYMLARVAFLEQSVCVLDVGRTLGRGPWRLFTSVALPLARPAIVGGVSLVLMETLNEFGAVQYFGVDTFTTGIYRTWFGMGEQVAAAQLAACLLAFIIVFVLLERWSRGKRRYFHTSSRYQQLPEYQLSGWRSLVAFCACGLPILIGFLLPSALLSHLAVRQGDSLFGTQFIDFAANSLVLATLAAAMAVGLALILSYGVRLHPGPVTRGATRIAAMGYAVPGSVAAPGLAEGCRVQVMIRPEALNVTELDEPALHRRSHIIMAKLLGRTSLLHICAHDTQGHESHLHARMPGVFLPAEGQPVSIQLDPSQVFVFPLDLAAAGA